MEGDLKIRFVLKMRNWQKARMSQTQRVRGEEVVSDHGVRGMQTFIMKVGSKLI